MRYTYKKKELEQIIKSMVVIVDTREQENSHILQYFDKKKINYKKKALEFGDYSFYVPKNLILGILRDTYFHGEIVVERKNSLDEFASNCTSGRANFVSELLRKKDSEFHLLIEDGSWEKIEQKMYRSEYTKESYIATLFSFISQYKIRVNFVSKDFAPQFIYNLFKYHLRNSLLKNEIEEVIEHD